VHENITTLLKTTYVNYWRQRERLKSRTGQAQRIPSAYSIHDHPWRYGNDGFRASRIQSPQPDYQCFVGPV